MVAALCATTCLANQKTFFGVWTPPSSLESFWAPIQERWWNTDKLVAYCNTYAKRSSPDQLVADIVLDLKRSPSVERTLVYSLLILHWDHKLVLKLLRPYYESKDADAHKIASDFIADIEEQDAERR